MDDIGGEREEEIMRHVEEDEKSCRAGVVVHRRQKERG